ncbi:MAG: hypothetical protein HY360_02520 [Verrucomicrobia bacterium]|nr:hypothetical protein [Verrucomicrobiota bacterium]
MNRLANILVIGLVLSARISALELQFAGVVGNSGEQGRTLVRSSIGRCGGGVVVDAQGRIFTGGGDRILTLNRDGKLLWQTPLPEEDWVLGGATFAIGGKHLYFVAGKPIKLEGNFHLLYNPFTLTEPNLCRVEMAPGAAAEVVAEHGEFHCEDGWPLEIALTATADGSRVCLGYTTSWKTSAYSVFEVCADGSLSPLFTKNVKGGRVSVDEAGNFYLGGDSKVQKFNPRGEPLDSFSPVALPGLGAVPTFYRGTVMLTRGALWDMGHYGFVGRFTRAMKPAPGAVVQWAHALGWVAQIADAPNDAYYIKSTDALYVARLEEEKLTLVRRFGALPQAHCLVLTANGYIGADGPMYAGMLWFDFDRKQPDAAPVRAEFPAPLTQGFAEGDSVLAYGIEPNHLPRDYNPPARGIRLLKFAPEPFVSGGNLATGEATGQFDGQLTAVAHVGNFYFAIDGQHQRLARAPEGKPCELVEVEVKTAPLTSLARFGQDRLLLGSGGGVRAFRVDADGALKPTWQMDRFGSGPAQAFGGEVYVAASGTQMLMADTRRHRVLLFGFGEQPDQPPAFVSQFGETDQAGDEAGRLSSPRWASISGAKAVVYDADNQRVVKLRIR